MRLEIVTTAGSTIYDPCDTGIFTWSSDIELPDQVRLHFSNREPHSTRVDEHGTILRNLSVVLRDLRLDGVSCWQYWLDHALVLTPDDGRAPYRCGRTVCDNGIITLDFDAPHAFFWLARSRLH
jgi:hypothetical protein